MGKYQYGKEGTSLDISRLQISFPSNVNFITRKTATKNYSCWFLLVIHSSICPGEPFDAHEFLLLLVDYFMSNSSE